MHVYLCKRGTVQTIFCSRVLQYWSCSMRVTRDIQLLTRFFTYTSFLSHSTLRPRNLIGRIHMITFCCPLLEEQVHFIFRINNCEINHGIGIMQGDQQDQNGRWSSSQIFKMHVEQVSMCQYEHQTAEARQKSPVLAVLWNNPRINTSWVKQLFPNMGAAMEKHHLQPPTVLTLQIFPVKVHSWNGSLLPRRVLTTQKPSHVGF